MNRVLVIDDDKELFDLMKKCIEQENLSAIIAHEGVAGLRLLEDNREQCFFVIGSDIYEKADLYAGMGG